MLGNRSFANEPTGWSCLSFPTHAPGGPGSHDQSSSGITPTVRHSHSLGEQALPFRVTVALVSALVMGSGASSQRSNAPKTGSGAAAAVAGRALGRQDHGGRTESTGAQGALRCRAQERPHGEVLSAAGSPWHQPRAHLQPWHSVPTVVPLGPGWGAGSWPKLSLGAGRGTCCSGSTAGMGGQRPTAEPRTLRRHRHQAGVGGEGVIIITNPPT